MWRKLIGITVRALGIFFAAFGLTTMVYVANVLGIARIPPGSCEQAEYRKITAPDGNKVALVVTMQCGAWGLQTEVSVAGGLAEFLASPPPPFFVANGAADIKVVWVDNTRLSLTFSAQTKVLRRELRVGDVEIDYVEPHAS